MRGAGRDPVIIYILILTGIVPGDLGGDFLKHSSGLLRIHPWPLHVYEPWLLKDNRILAITFGEVVQAFTVSQSIGRRASRASA